MPIVFFTSKGYFLSFKYAFLSCEPGLFKIFFSIGIIISSWLLLSYWNFLCLFRFGFFSSKKNYNVKRLKWNDSYKTKKKTLVLRSTMNHLIHYFAIYSIFTIINGVLVRPDDLKIDPCFKRVVCINKYRSWQRSPFNLH